jgi:anti-sigma regulatory factor (Ser/Thr protein kinase)
MKALTRCVIPPVVSARTRPAAQRRSVVDLVDDIRTLTADADSVVDQRDQALRALAATVAAIRSGSPLPELFALPVLTRLGLVPAPGADPHEILGGVPWWAVQRDGEERELHADDEKGGALRRTAVVTLDSRAPGYARHLVTAVQYDWQLAADAAEDARTVISELVTNVVRHAVFASQPRAIPLSVAWSADRTELVVSVSDPDPRVPEAAVLPGAAAVLSPAVHAGEGGAGLFIVQALTSRLTVDLNERGKTVAAVIAVPGGAR